MDRNAKSFHRHSSINRRKLFSLGIANIYANKIEFIQESFSISWKFHWKIFHFLYFYVEKVQSKCLQLYWNCLVLLIHRIFCINFQRKLKCRTFRLGSKRQNMVYVCSFFLFEGDKLSPHNLQRTSLSAWMPWLKNGNGNLNSKNRIRFMLVLKMNLAEKAYIFSNDSTKSVQIYTLCVAFEIRSATSIHSGFMIFIK